VYDSLLSEFAAMGFEYGYSVIRPDALVMWEAQFGDFVNGAQTIIDEFIAAGEQKWAQRSDVTLLLPHGYEGQGPDHSSARVERFLQLCAQDNITVAMPSTPASYFHLLRWQVHSPLIRPLVIFTPKSLLRAKYATSKTSDFTNGSFTSIQKDVTVDKNKVTKVLLCSGKVYYDLVDYRTKNKITDTAIIRVEQLYPLHKNALAKLSDTYGHGTRLIWAQEESQNMGAWSYIAPQLEEIFGRKPTYAGRDASASPAVGNLALHRLELAAFLNDAFTL
jgi:2-oxoglutarate dehydrogenase E1 component